MLTSHARPRFEEVDALRGLAALVVVLHHAHEFWNEPYGHAWRLFKASPLGMLQAGPDAVLVFFVMSGFVLFLPYTRAEGPDPYPQYLVKRVCRIYLPYLAGLLVAVGADLLFQNPVLHAAKVFDNWQNWVRPFPMHVFWKHVALVLTPSLSEFNPAFWSLSHEMRISILFPLVALLAKKRTMAQGLAIGFVSCMVSFLISLLPGCGDFSTLGYGGLFVMGATIAQNLPAVRGWLATKTGWHSAGMVLVAYALLKVTHAFPPKYYQWWSMVPLHGLAAVIVLVLALKPGYFHGFLMTRPMQWFGKVSYSLYLLHWTVFYALANCFWERTTHHALLLGAGFLLTLPLSAAFFRWVERPSIILGRYLTRSHHGSEAVAKS